MRISNQRKFISGIIALILGIAGLAATFINGYDTRLLLSALLLVAIGIYNLLGSRKNQTK